MRIGAAPLLALSAALAPCAAQTSIPELASRMETARGSLAPAGEPAAGSDIEFSGRVDVPTGSFDVLILVRREPFAYREELRWHGVTAGGAETAPPPGHARRTVFLSNGARCWNLADEVGPAGPMAGLASVELLDTANLFRLLLDPVATLERVAVKPRFVTDELQHAVEEDHADVFFSWPHGTSWVATIPLASGQLVNLADSTGVTHRWYRALEWRPLGDGLVFPSRIEFGSDRLTLGAVRLQSARAGLRHAPELFAGDPAAPLPERLDATRLLVTGHPVPGAAAFVLPEVAVHGAASAGSVWTVFDTGAIGFYIHPELADGLGLLTIGAESTSGVFGNRRTMIRWIDRFDLGRYALLQVPAPDPPPPPFNELPAEDSVGAIIGGPRLMELSPVLDLRAGRLVLRGGPTVRPLSELAGRPAALVPLAIGRNGYLALEVLVGGTSLDAALDTGLPFVLRLARSDLPRLGLPADDDAWRRRGALPYRMTAMSGQAGDDLLVRLEQDVSLGSLTLRQPWVVIASSHQDGPAELPTLVGAGALSALDQVGFDWARRRLELVPPDALVSSAGEGAAPHIVVPPPGRFLGFILDPPDRGAMTLPHDLPHVISVMPGTPAAEAGLRQKDMLAQAGGVECEGRAPMDLWPRLHALPEGAIELRVRREGLDEVLVLRIEP